MSVLTEFKVYQKRAFELDKCSAEFAELSDQMDILWIQLSTDEMSEVQEYERQLWIESGKCSD
jgi:hypothetical protein